MKADRQDVGKQSLAAVAYVGNGVINRKLLEFESDTQIWLDGGHKAVIEIRCFLKIADSGPHKDHVEVSKFSTQARIDAKAPYIGDVITGSVGGKVNVELGSYSDALRNIK